MLSKELFRRIRRRAINVSLGAALGMVGVGIFLLIAKMMTPELELSSPGPHRLILAYVFMLPAIGAGHFARRQVTSVLQFDDGKVDMLIAMLATLGGYIISLAVVIIGQIINAKLTALWVTLALPFPIIFPGLAIWQFNRNYYEEIAKFEAWYEAQKLTDTEGSAKNTA